ncbi:MAG: 2,4-dihydroxyhept-2-ene-1,7-dioic acid aldolase [Acidobacteria bacterium]|nr:2,4-dihydroxyhept-2-ene-1,7-dioic acid aldolase [Acidobacteriota bacterium]
MNQLHLKRDLRSHRVTIGSWITLAHPSIAEILARAGFDWLTVDLEHSVITIEQAGDLIRIIELCGVAPLVRLSFNDPVQAKRVMDAGAHGVIVPMVNSRAEAERAVAAVRYPPRGARGVGLARAQGYGAGFEEYRAWLERESVVIVQIEHIQAVEHLDEILRVEGVDGFLVGPYDLSGSLQVPGQFEHPAMLEALAEIRRVASARNAAAGYHVVHPRPDLVIEKIEQGYCFLAYSVDMLFLGEMCRHGVRAIQAAADRRLAVPTL